MGLVNDEEDCGFVVKGAATQTLFTEISSVQNHYVLIKA